MTGEHFIDLVLEGASAIPIDSFGKEVNFIAKGIALGLSSILSQDKAVIIAIRNAVVSGYLMRVQTTSERHKEEVGERKTQIRPITPQPPTRTKTLPPPIPTTEKKEGKRTL